MEHEQADGVIADRECHRDSARFGPIGQAQRAGVTAARRQAGDVRFGQRKPGGGRHLEHFARRQRTASAGRKHQCGPARREDALHRVDDVRLQLREIQVTDEGLRQLVEPPGLLGSSECLLPGPSQLGDDLRHHEDHHEVDEQGDPVLRRADRQRVVRGQEEIVVEEEAAQRTDHPGDGAAHNDTGERRQDEEQRGDRDADVRSQRQQDSQHNAQPGESGQHSQNAVLVPSHGEPAWLHECHCFPRVRLSSECTDMVVGAGEARWT